MGVVLATVMIWRPTEGLFAQDAGVIVGSYIEGDQPLDLPDIHRELALWLGENAETNRAMLEVQCVKERKMDSDLKLAHGGAVGLLPGAT